MTLAQQIAAAKRVLNEFALYTIDACKLAIAEMIARAEVAEAERGKK